MNSGIKRCEKLLVWNWQLIRQLQDEREQHASNVLLTENVREREYTEKVRDDYFHFLMQQ
jgi:hypothetical protein